MNKTRLVIIGGILIVLSAAAVQFLLPHSAVSPSLPASRSSSSDNANTIPTNSTSTITSTNSNTSSNNSILVSSIEKEDSIISWNFTGAYADRPDLIAKANAEIARLSGLIGKGIYSDTILFVSIANQYGLLGDGKQEYEYLNRAVEAGGNTTGLPWHNLGVLMERLGALQTARIAYENATLVQPEIKEWHYAYLTFLTARMKNYTTGIEKAFAAAKKNLGQDSDILQIYSEWKNV